MRESLMYGSVRGTRGNSRPYRDASHRRVGNGFNLLTTGDYLPQSLISDVPKIVAGLRAGQSFSAIPVPDPPVIRRGASGTFYDKGLEGASHHAVIPNVNMIDKLREVWPRLSPDEKKLFDVIARAYLAALMPDFRYRQTTATLDVRGFEFRAAGRQPIDLGWRAAFPEWQPADDKETRPPPRYNEGTPIEAMQNAWRFVDDEVLRNRLGIGTPDPSGDHQRSEETGFPYCPGKAHRADRGRLVAVRYCQTGRPGPGRSGSDGAT
jgi:hypothetical protein